MGFSSGGSVSVAAAANTEFNGPFSLQPPGGEQTVFESLVATRRRVNLVFNNQNMTKTGTFRLYIRSDGVTFDQYDSTPVTIGAGDDRTFSYEITTNQAYRLTYLMASNEGVPRDIDFHIIEEPLE